jgi:SAM-dependent methyltransferase
MSDALANPYDAVDYPGHAFADTHPSRIAAVGILHGMQPPELENCRVLELGCGDGANLIPMAYELPSARFVGIDLAERPVARGQLAVTALGLRNIDLRVMNVMDVTREIGEFDYIIAHGLFSWVPEEVRARVLEICAWQLAPNGIAFISFLVQPGNHVREVLRELLTLFGSKDVDPTVRVRKARELMRLFSGPSGTDPFQELARSQAAEFDKLQDGAIYHDWLAPINAAMYITEFVGLAALHGLAFVGEAEYFMTRYEHDPTLHSASAELERLEEQDVVMKEQLLDFLRCRRFRQTLLCRANVPLSRPAPERVLSLAAASPLKLVGQPSVSSHQVAEFRSPHDVSLRIDHPVAKAALRRLGREWPSVVPVEQLLADARAETGRKDAASAAGDAQVLCGVLLACYGAAHAELYARAPRLVLHPGERPRASAVARAEITRAHLVTTLRHESLRIDDPLGAALLSLLDGTRERQAIADALLLLIESGRIPAPAGAERDVRAGIAQGLEASLQGLARSGLLEA